MKLLFKKLNEIISTETEGKHSLTVSETLKNKKQGDLVLVGGLVKNIFTIFDDEPTVVVLDDGIGEVYVEIIPEIFEKVSSKISLGGIIIIKGYYSRRKLIGRRPDDEKVFSSVMCSAVATIEEIDNVSKE